MNEQNEKIRGKTIRLAFFVGSLCLPFVLQTSHLNAVKGGWRPELGNFASILVLPALLLPLVSLIFLPFSWKAKVVMLVLFLPVFVLAFGFYTLTLACGKYGYIGSCF